MALTVGTRVETQWTEDEGGDDEWYAGSIIAVNGTEVTIEYDDGDEWTGDASFVRVVRPEIRRSASNLVRITPDKLSRCFRLWKVLGALACLLIVLAPAAIPNGISGEIPLWYELPLCKSDEAKVKNGTSALMTTQPAKYVLHLGETDATPAQRTVCNDGCRTANDGDCDDGGQGADYGLCELGSDCQDCGARATELPGYACPSGKLRPSPPAVIKLELLDGFVQRREYAPALLFDTGHAALLTFQITDAAGATVIPQMTLQLGAGQETFPWSTAEAGSAAASPNGRRLLHAQSPSSRRLLKGGSTSSTGGFGFSSGRASYGSSRWGSASGRVGTRVARVPPIFNSRGGGGGRTPARGTPVAQGRPVGSGVSRSPIGSYYFGARAVSRGAYFTVVPPARYGCFSCGYYATRLSHSAGCDGSRGGCGQTTGFSADSDLDRFELAEATFIAPSDRTLWPLTLTVSRIELYQTTAALPSPMSSKTLLFSFSSDDGDRTLTLRDRLVGIAWTFVYLSFFIPFFVILGLPLLLHFAPRVSRAIVLGAGGLVRLCGCQQPRATAKKERSLV